MKPRITFAVTADGSLEMYFNAEGRDAFIRELSKLNERHEHFHFAPPDMESELDVCSRAYREGDRVLDYGKVLFRTDEWDRQYYPAVMED